MTSQDRHDRESYDRQGDGVTLREFFEVLLRKNEQLHDERFKALDARIDAASVVTDARLETLNNLRQTVERDRAQFVTNEVYNTKTDYYDVWCRGVDKVLTELRTERATVIAMVMALMSAGLSVIAIAVHFWK